MKHLLRLSDLGEKGIYEVFRLADELGEGKHRDALCGKTAVLFFPSASLRTRVTFEKGIASLGGHPILFPPERREAFRLWQITSARMEHARPGALLNPCPPFTRGEEVSEDAVASPYFAGYSFKSCLLEVQQAVLLYCMG